MMILFFLFLLTNRMMNNLVHPKMTYRPARGKLIDMGQDTTLTGKTVTTVVVENELMKDGSDPEIIVATTFKEIKTLK